ncbi:hypothetical protein GJAV_G00260590 [Gymnothorax javanicus]|nr:hypothetical protein GJAV_G00260590 [Gymnothorax javanicus]
MAQAAQINEINTPIAVEHDRKRRQFTVRLNGSHDRAVLLYEYVGKRTVDLQHTEVPDAYRGRGIAKHLAKAAMDFVVEEDLKAHLTCWYIQKLGLCLEQACFLYRQLGARCNISGHVSCHSGHLIQTPFLQQPCHSWRSDKFRNFSVKAIKCQQTNIDWAVRI